MCSSVGWSRLWHYWSYCCPLLTLALRRNKSGCVHWAATETNVFSWQHYHCFIFFCTFPFYTTVTVIQDLRKKQLQWGTALKHSYFVPFFLMQTFHGLSTWITFWWCCRTIFARTYLIAVLSTLYNVHSLHLHYICIIYALPKTGRFYIKCYRKAALFVACVSIYLNQNPAWIY